MEQKNKNCLSCGKQVGEGSIIFKCPACGKEIIRCGHCRKLTISYKCLYCGFEGP